MARSAEPFVRVPKRLCSALAAGELSSTRLAILVVLLEEADRRGGRASFTLARLAKALAWEWSPEWLRRQLQRLRRDGWISYQTTRGQRSPYLFTLERAGLIETATSNSPPTDLQPTSNPPPTPDLKHPGDEAGRDLTSHAVSDPSEPPTLARARGETETETETSSLLPAASNGERAERAAATKNSRPYIQGLNKITGCELVRGTHSFGHRYDVLGTDRPPADWPYPTPTYEEIVAAKRARGLL